MAVSTVDLARLQFATTSLYHLLFVPLTLGLGPLVAVMHTCVQEWPQIPWVYPASLKAFYFARADRERKARRP